MYDVQLYTSCNFQDYSKSKSIAADNGLSLNPSKSRSILITRNKLDNISLSQLEVNDSYIELVDQFKNVGICF